MSSGIKGPLSSLDHAPGWRCPNLFDGGRTHTYTSISRIRALIASPSSILAVDTRSRATPATYR